MKFIFLLLLVLCTSIAAWSQENWSNAIPPNPDFDSPTNPTDVVMYNGKLYQVHDSAGTYLEVSVYNPGNMQWNTLAFLTSTNFMTNLKASVVNGKLYFVGEWYPGFTMFSFDFNSNTITNLGSTSGFSSIGSWDMYAVPSASKIYVANVDNGMSVFLNQFDLGLQTWGSFDVSNQINPVFQSVFDDFVFYSSNTDIYFGLSGSINRFGRASFANLAGFTAYNSGSGGTGEVMVNGASANVGGLYFSGNGQLEPIVTIRDASTNISYEKSFSTTTINAIPGTDTPLDFNINASATLTALYNPAYSFLSSTFSSNGPTTPNDKFYVYRKDLGTNIWDSLGTPVEFGVFNVTGGSMRMSLDTQEKHLSIFYRDQTNNNNAKLKVLNNIPQVQPGTAVANSGLCLGSENQILPAITFLDYDNEPIRITTITSANNTWNNLYAVGVGYDNTGNPNSSKFAVYGTPTTITPDDIIITYTDGWNIFTQTIPNVTVSSTPPSIGFTSAIVTFCNNENIIDLTNYVNYFDQGVFKLNGQVLPNTTIDGTSFSAATYNGTLEYRVNVNGCIVNSSAVYNVALVGTASTSTVVATCGNSDGSASVSYTPGTSTTYTVEWSTGENSPTISSLAPGAYYYNVTDQYNCHVTGFASVPANGVTVTPTINNVSCNGLTNGSITLAIGGPSTYTILWSNGYSGPQISNLAPGNYTATVTDATGCHTTYSYDITQPAPITASFTTYDPDCGTSNGVIYGTYSGGVSPLNYNWLGQSQTTPDLTNVPYGFYQVQVTDAQGCQALFGYQIDDYQAVDIQDSVVNASCNTNDGAIFIKFNQDQNGGTLANSITWSNGTLFPNNFSLLSGTYTIDVISGLSNNCHSVKTITVGTKAPAGQDICIVTVDTATTTNLVVWEKNELVGIDYYKIYRETTNAGQYQLIDTVDFNNLSVFNDVVASPLDRSWRYRISAVNTCGIEGPISSEHKTLHLNTIAISGNGGTNILWDDYEGSADVANYVIWRKSDQSPWQPVSGPIAIGTSAFNEGPIAGETNFDYYIELVLSTFCSAEKSQDFNTVRSNRERGSFAAGEGTGASSNGLAEGVAVQYAIYPNPATDNLTLVLSDVIGNYKVVIYDALGVQVINQTIESQETNLDVSQLTQGLYFIQVNGSNNLKKFVKQ